MLFLEGGLRLMPGWEFVIGQYTVSMNILVPGVVIPGLLFTVLALWPFIEAFATGDTREHHVLDRPRNAPFRTAFGVAFLTAFMILVLAGSNDLIATHFHLSINDITWTFRVLFFVAPPLAFWITKRICLSLQRKDRELVLHGHETGRIVRFASGEYIEVHKPLDAHERWLRVQHEPRRPLEIEPAEDSRGVRRKGYRIDAARRRLSKVFYEDRVEPVTPAELAAAQSHGGHDALPLAHDERREELTAGASGSRHLAPEPEDTEGTQRR
jgi:ubiquinol-cytochrome c reductase cytochrome b subunit